MKRSALKRRTALRRAGRAARLHAALDAGDRRIFRDSSPRCARCGTASGIELHHVVSRGVRALRHDRENHLALCRDCHRWWHDNLKVARAWFEERFPGRLAALKAKVG